MTYEQIISTTTQALTAISGLVLAGSAIYGLTAWKKQIKIKCQIDFLDGLTEAVHRFILEFSNVTQVLDIVQLAIECHEEPSDQAPWESIKKYIDKKPHSELASLRHYLNQCQEPLSRVQALVAKGQIFDLPNYDECKRAWDKIEHRYSEVQWFQRFIEKQSWYWQNPEVQASADDAARVDSSELRETIKQANSEYLKFATETYSRLLG